MAILYPTLHAHDIKKAIEIIEQIDSYASGYQIDFMDGRFVPPITEGSDFINEFAKHTYKQLWIHLMVQRANEWLERFSLQPDTIITFHIESDVQINQTINRINEKKWLSSIAINPNTPLEEVFQLLPMVHQVLVMSVDPGFSGQEFLKDTCGRIAKLSAYRQTSGLQFRIGVDGGVNRENITDLINEGADDLAVSSAIFGSDHPVKALKELNDIAGQTERT